MTIDDVRARLAQCVADGTFSHGPHVAGVADLRALLDDHARLAAEVERMRRPADPASPRATPLAEQVLTMVHAFHDSGRKDAVRSLAAQIAAVEAEVERLTRERDEALGVLAAANDRTIGWQHIAEEHGSAKDAAESDRDRLRAEVERLTRERDEARADRDRAESSEPGLSEMRAERDLRAERDALAAALAEVRSVVYLALHDSEADRRAERGER